MIDPSALPVAFWVAAPLTILFAYTVFGMSGFGSTVVATPILAHWVPLTVLVPVMVITDLSAAILVGGKNRQHVSRPELKRLLPCVLLGLVLGVTVLVNAPAKPLNAALGVFAMAIGVNYILNPEPRSLISAWWSVPIGTVAGVLSAVFGTGGPLYVVYLTGRLRDKHEIRATVSTTIVVSAFLRAGSYLVAGLLAKAAVLGGAAMSAPFALLGIRLGSRLHTNLSGAQLRRAIGGLLVATGGILLARMLA